MDLHPQTLRYNTLVRRFWAALIDELLFTPVLLADLYLFSLRPEFLWWSLWTAFSTMLPHLYFIYFNGRFGHTLGKKLLHLRIRDKDGGSITYAQAFGRAVPLMIVSFVFAALDLNDVLQHGMDRIDVESSLAKVQVAVVMSVVALSLFTALRDKRRRTFYDQLAGTVVIRTDVD